MSITAKIEAWGSLQESQRWFCQGERVFRHSKELLPQGRFVRLFSGSNSLACAIQQMTKEILQAKPQQGTLSKSESKASAEFLDTDRLGNSIRVLQEKIASKVAKYNQNHTWIYKLFMRIIGRDVDAAKRQFDAVCATIPAKVDVQSKVIPSKSLFPIDGTEQLASILQHSQFSLLSESGKFVKLSIYIHMLPLAKHLKASFSEVADLLMSQSLGREDYQKAALVLIQSKTGMTPDKDPEKILEILDDCGMTSFFYHGTNIHALAVMKEHGLGSVKRDYDIELLKRIGVIWQKASGMNKAAFYVAGKADVSYGYANRSPEWVFTAQHLEKTAGITQQDYEQYQALKAKYSKVTQIALLQIKFPHINRTAAERAALIKYVRENGLSIENDIIQHSIMNNNIDKRIENGEFNPESVVYYLLPRLSIKS